MKHILFLKNSPSDEKGVSIQTFDSREKKATALRMRLQQIFASTIGSAAATFTLNPINVMKISLQNSIRHDKSIRNILRTLLAEKGLRGLW